MGLISFLNRTAELAVLSWPPSDTSQNVGRRLISPRPVSGSCKTVWLTHVFANAFTNTARLMHAYEVRPRKDHRGVDLISYVLPFGRL